MGNFVEGIAVSGEYMDTLKDKSFVILKNPKYVTVPDFKDKTKESRKLLLFIELMANKSQLDYYPNKTSQKTLFNTFGADMDQWIGKKCLFKVVTQMVSGKEQRVLFVSFQPETK